MGELSPTASMTAQAHAAGKALSQTPLAEMQAEFTRHIRNPAAVPQPAGIESRRMKIYNDLVYNNIEGFISGGFPVLHSLYRAEDWHRLVRSFVAGARCESPYFLEISQEFLRFLNESYQPSPVDPAFLLELAHYEWVELALDVDPTELPLQDPAGDPIAGVPRLSPLAWSLCYQYPVHRIGPGYEPNSPPAEPTYLVVYRNRQERVEFLESNAATARLLELLRENQEQRCGRELLEQLAAEMNADPITSVVEFGVNLLQRFCDQDIVLCHA
jgi:hypothetical protein